MTAGHPRPDHSCPTWRQRLEAYIDGELRSDEAAAVCEHLRRCPTCLAEVGALSELSQNLRALGAASAPPELWDSIAARLRVPRAAGVAVPCEPAGGWLSRRAALALAAGVAVAAASGTYALLPDGGSVVTAAVDDFVTYRARDWTVDHAARDAHSLAAWAQARLAFAVPEFKERFGSFEVSGVRLCWLLNRRLFGLTYASGADRAVVYVMEAQGLALPAADRTLPNGTRASLHQVKGHGVAVWTESDLVFALVAAEKEFARILQPGGLRAGALRRLARTADRDSS